MRVIKSGLTFNQAIKQIIKNKKLLITRKEWKEGYYGKRYLNFKDWEEHDCGAPCSGLKETELDLDRTDGVFAISTQPYLYPIDFLAKDWQVWKWEK